VSSDLPLLDQTIELLPKLPENLVIREMPERLRPALEVHVARRAPHAEVGVVRFTRPVHPAAHDRDRDVVLLRVRAHFSHVLSQIDERLVLDARAGRTADDVQSLVLEARHGPEAAALDVVEDLMSDRDLVAFFFERQRERDADRVADAARDELLEGDARLDDA